ncbi:MAG: OmpA family protein [Pigmentiphaga sp.]|nr:OmpA family protein [Pigmentiphaga sp.]
MRSIAEGPGGLPLRADLIAQQKRLRELEDRVRKMRQAPWPAPPAEDGEGEGWLLSYLDLLTLLLVMLVVMLAMSEPKSASDEPAPASLAAADGAPVVPEPSPPAVASAVAALLVGSTAELPSGSLPRRGVAAWHELTTLLPPEPVALPVFEPSPAQTIGASLAALTADMPYTPVPALVALAPPRPSAAAPAPPADAPGTPAPAAAEAGATTESTPPPVADVDSARGMPELDLSLLGEGVDVIVRERSVSFRISNELLFDLGQVELTPRGIDVLRRVVQVVRDTSLPITVEGHTDPLPIRNERFPSNWELSTFRATSVLRLLIDAGVDPQRLRAIGYADTKPIADNTGADGRALNRRVELILEMPTATGPTAHGR